MQTHPKWKYHASLTAVVVDDEAAEEALGAGWFDSQEEADESGESVGAVDDDKITEAERLGLLDLARDMGLKPHHRLSGDKLLTMIQEERDRLAAARDAE